jgi:hypothetical protein
LTIGGAFEAKLDVGSGLRRETRAAAALVFDAASGGNRLAILRRRHK